MWTEKKPLHVILLAVVFYLCLCVLEVSSHVHTHPKSDHANGEREQDGNFASRAQNHLRDDIHETDFDHEAILGSRDAADEYDQLSPEEAKRRLQELAVKMDKDGDGYVDRTELIEWILRSFKLLTQEEAAERFEDEDKDGDGKVTWDEHVREAFGSSHRDADPNEEDDLRLMEEDDRYFKAADANKDGALDKEEFPKFSHPSEFPEMQNILYEETMKKKDADRDGYLSLEEFASEDADKPLTSEQFLVEKERFEMDYDRNGDKKLDKQETLNWLLPGNEEIAEQEADHLLENGDTDKDGKLSIREIVDHHDLFVGSEATDYGEHLHNTSRFTDEL
ncbi:reticulocalbin-2 [Ixodes scapularis]|uniref:reticulocalbin-2 n=1 Tax=Ixodes scapularis TaxID=6945 RepID=UPI001A9EDED7|nr:reticulocalbin-2 [Ixodes scapularis]